MSKSNSLVESKATDKIDTDLHKIFASDRTDNPLMVFNITGLKSYRESHGRIFGRIYLDEAKKLIASLLTIYTVEGIRENPAREYNHYRQWRQIHFAEGFCFHLVLDDGRFNPGTLYTAKDLFNCVRDEPLIEGAINKTDRP